MKKMKISGCFPATLVLHGHDEQTRLSTEWVADQRPDPQIQAAIRRILVSAEDANTGLEEWGGGT